MSQGKLASQDSSEATFCSPLGISHPFLSAAGLGHCKEISAPRQILSWELEENQASPDPGKGGVARGQACGGGTWGCEGPL